MMSRLLIVSCHLSGGCFQYSNEIIRHLEMPAHIYVPKKVGEHSVIEGIRKQTFLLWGYPNFLRFFSLIWLLIKIFILGSLGYYHSLLLFGFAGWDYYIMRAWKLTDRPSFFVVHDGKMHIGEENSKRQNELCYIMRNATNLVFLSEYVHELVETQFNIDKPFHIAHHGMIDYGRILLHEQHIKPTILFLGRVTQYKGVNTLLNAIRLVPMGCYSKLIIAGKWDRNIVLGPSNEKVLMDDRFLSNDEILHYLEICDIMVFPYHEATQSGVATLAINYLKPSIVTNVGAFSEQFTNNSAVFIEPDNPDVLANAITELCLDVSKRQRMVEAIKLERSRFEWPSIAKGLNNYIASEIQR